MFELEILKPELFNIKDTEKLKKLKNKKLKT
jgi:hypothetical protein